MKIIFSFILFTFSLLKAQGQILNIDKTDTSDYVRKSKLSLNFSSGLEIDKQKITLYDATNTAEFMWQQYKELFIVAGSYRFTYNGPDNILNAGFIHIRYRHNYKNTFQPEPFVQYQWDSNRGMVHRFLAGANARYNFWRADKFEFNAGIGLMYEDEKWNYNAVDSSKIPANAQPVITHFLKINSYVRFNWKTNKNNDIIFNIFLQTRPNRFKPRIAPSAQWNIKAGKHTSFSIAFSGVYDVKPVVPIENFYYSLSNSLLINF